MDKSQEFKENWLPALQSKYKVEKGTGHCYTIFGTKYGVIDFYPKVNRCMLRHKSRWIKPGLEWLIKELLNEY